MTTNDEELAKVIRTLANYGSQKNMSLNTQAAIAVWMRYRRRYSM